MPHPNCRSGGDGKIRAPMDGAIVNLLVTARDTVVKGQTFIDFEGYENPTTNQVGC